MNYVLDYMNEYYDLTVSGLVSYTIVDKFNKQNISGHVMTNDVMKIFHISQDEFSKSYDEWLNRQLIKLNNEFVDYQTETYKKTGVMMNISPQLLNGSNKAN